MAKKSKVIDLFGNDREAQNTEVKYSELLSDFIKPFEPDFPKDFDIEDVYEFALNAWNMANMSQIVPKADFDVLISETPMPEPEHRIFKKMVTLKNKKYKNYDRYIQDFDLRESDKGELKLEVLTVNSEKYLTDMMDTMMDDPMQSQYQEGLLNRAAIVVKPKQPFFDWLNKLYPEDPINEETEANVYLVTEEIDDLEKWLKKRFDVFFKIELHDWHTSKKQWPMKRTYAMFNEWFTVHISSMIYDMEAAPIYKE